jgi:hypothetical protein
MTVATRRTLFDISSDLLALDALLEEIGGDVSDPTVAATIDAWFSELAYDESRKLESWVGYVRQLEMEAAAAREESERFLVKARVRESRMAWLKDRMKAYLESSGRTKVTTEAGRTLMVQKNGGKAPLTLEPVDLDAVPVELVRVRRELDMEAVRSALEAGQRLAFASLAERGTHLRVK